MASVRQLTRQNKDGRRPWAVDYVDATGKRRLATPKTGLKKDADALRRKIEGEIERGEHVATRETIRINDLADEYIEMMETREREGRGVGKVYLNSVKTAIRLAIRPHIGNIRLAELTYKQVEIIPKAMAKEGKSPKTIKMRLDTLYNMVDYAIRRKYAAINVVGEVIKDRKGAYSPPIRTFTKDQALQVLRTLETTPLNARREAWLMRKVFVHIAAFCGLRFGEIAGLQVDHIDFEAGLIKIRSSITRHDELKGPKTRAGVRDVGMPSHVAALLQEWLSTYYKPNQRGLVFRNERGTAVNASNFNKRWHALLDLAGLPADEKGRHHHFHALRHFAGSLMVDHGFPVTEVAAILGHKSFDITLQRYLHTLAGGSRRVTAMQGMATALIEPPEALTIEYQPVA